MSLLHFVLFIKMSVKLSCKQKMSLEMITQWYNLITGSYHNFLKRVFVFLQIWISLCSSSSSSLSFRPPKEDVWGKQVQTVSDMDLKQHHHPAKTGYPHQFAVPQLQQQSLTSQQFPDQDRFRHQVPSLTFFFYLTQMKLKSFD